MTPWPVSREGGAARKLAHASINLRRFSIKSERAQAASLASPMLCAKATSLISHG